MEDLGWNDDFYSDQELRTDNDLLKKQLGLSGNQFHENTDMSPYAENQFLRCIKEFDDMENGPKRELSSIFPVGFDFPDVNTMSQGELSQIIEDIEEILAEHNIYMEFTEELPLELIYEYFVNHELHSEIALEFPDGVKYHINGCDGYCRSCFQREYCKTGQQSWPNE